MSTYTTRKPGVIRVPVKEYARMEWLLLAASSKACSPSCLPRCCCGAEKFNNELAKWKRDCRAGFPSKGGKPKVSG